MEFNTTSTHGEGAHIDAFDALGSLTIATEQAEQVLGRVIFNPHAFDRQGKPVPNQPILFYDKKRSLRDMGRELWGDAANLVTDEELPSRMHELREGIAEIRRKEAREHASRRLFGLFEWQH